MPETDTKAFKAKPRTQIVGVEQDDFGKQFAAERRPKRSKAPNNDVWTFTVHGTYTGKENGLNREKVFNVIFKMPDKQVEKGALSQSLKHYAPTMLPKLYPDYQNFLTHEIVLAKCTNAEKELNTLSVMPRHALIEYIELEDLPVHPELYVDAAELRTAIEECTNPKTSQSFTRNQDLKREKLGDKVIDATIAIDFLEQSLEESKIYRKKAFASQADDL